MAEAPSSVDYYGGEHSGPPDCFEGPFPIGGLQDLQDRLAYPQEPNAEIRQKRISVVLRVLVSSTGTVDSVRYITDSSKIRGTDSSAAYMPKYVEAAKKVVLQTEFRGADDCGTPVDCWISLPVNFRKRAAIQLGRLEAKIFRGPLVDSPP